jgi:uncharacterized damage-inducible protein DinB
LRKQLALFAFVSLLMPALAIAQNAPPGIRGEIIHSMLDAGGKIQELAGAIPDGKYTWKPSKDVRSTGQVLLHVVASNYMLPSLFGVKSPMTADEMQKLDTQTMEPAKIRQMLKDSYAWATQAVADTPDSTLEAPINFFGQKMTRRGGMLALASHSHEHLGQLIAYARANNITPPWTARELELQKQKKAAEKKAGSGK